MRSLRTFADLVYTLAKYVAIAALGLMTFVVVLNIVARSALNASFSWSEEVCRFLLIWSSLLGAAMAVRRAAHFRLDLAGVLPRWVAVVLPRLPASSAIVTGALLIWQGLVLMNIAAMQLATATQIPMSIPYAGLPLGGALMLLFGIEAFLSHPQSSASDLVK